MTDPKQYEIAGKKFRQEPLSLGQGEHLLDAVKNLTINTNSLDAASVITLLGDSLPKMLALVLIEEGKRRGDNIRLFDEGGAALEAAIQFMKDEVEYEIALDAVSDFFTCNPIGSLSTKFEAMGKKMTQAASGGGALLRNSTQASAEGSRVGENTTANA